MPFQNRRSILSQEPDLMMESNASLLTWGAVCESVCTGDFGLQWKDCLTKTSVCSKTSLPEQGQFPYPPEVRQPDSSTARDLLSPTPVQQFGHLTMDMVPGQGNNLVSRTLTSSRQLCGRLPSPFLSRMGAPQGHLPKPDGSLPGFI